ncbi:MAG TPA: hypothetical protein VEX18_22885 [Polyangiaceae bacterium]|nr:hypothetical protein [Polyangiaceae bacterium]
MSALRLVQVVLACGALGMPFALAASAASGYVEPLSRAAVDVLLVVSTPLRASAAVSVAEAPLERDELLASETTLAASGKVRAAPKGRTARSPAHGALFVSAAKVLELSQSAARPQGAFVQATATHPAGLRLAGVAGLGIGVQDGDILTEALGITPQSPGQIIGAIIEARAKQARYLSGTLWRRGQVLRITVEQPYFRSESGAGAGARPAHESVE